MSVNQVILQYSNETIQNSTSSFASSFDLFGPVLFIVWSLIVVAVVSAARSNTYFERLIDALGFVAVSVVYFLHGVAFIAGLAVLMAPAYFVANADPGTQQTVGKYALLALIAYAAITGLGYVAKGTVIDPIRENINEALPEPEDDESGEAAEVSD